MADISFYFRLNHQELLAERARLREIELKILSEWTVIEGLGQTQYIPVAQANLRRLYVEVRLLMAAIKSHDDCEGKLSFETKHKAAVKAARARKAHGSPTMSYYKCPRCKMYHLTSNGTVKMATRGAA